MLVLLLYIYTIYFFFFFFSSRRRHTRLQGDWSSDVCSSDLLEISVDEVPRRLGDFFPHREVVLYCACPNEASAAYAAKKLLDRGYVRVRPLLGGLDAWVAAGHEVEHRPRVVPLSAASTTAAPQ